MSVDEEQISRSPEDLRDLAVREQSRAAVPSLVLGTARAGQTLDAHAVGVADIERGVAAAPDVAYRIGSITKTFTAALTLTLVEDGVVRPVGRIRLSTCRKIRYSSRMVTATITPDGRLEPIAAGQQVKPSYGPHRVVLAGPLAASPVRGARSGRGRSLLNGVRRHLV